MDTPEIKKPRRPLTTDGGAELDYVSDGKYMAGVTKRQVRVIRCGELWAFLDGTRWDISAGVYGRLG